MEQDSSLQERQAICNGQDDGKSAVAGLRYEAALAQLEKIVERLENDELELEDSIAAYKRGVELLRHCEEQLSEAERKVEVLSNGG